MQSDEPKKSVPNTLNVKHNDLDELPEWWPKTFAVYRTKDNKNLSGNGFAILGVVFENGKVVIYWRSTGCVATFDSFSMFERVHLNGAAHGSAEVLWIRHRLKKVEADKEKPEKIEDVNPGKNVVDDMAFWGR